MMTVEELSRETDNHCDDEDIEKGLSKGGRDQIMREGGGSNYVSI